MMKVPCWLLAMAALLLLSSNLLAVSGDDELVRRPDHSRRASLDQTSLQLLYVRTTDYGATWSTVRQAGDLTPLASGMLSPSDFSAVAMVNNELCYAMALLNAPIPGVYAFSGPLFMPVLVMAQGSNTFSVGSSSQGWTDIGRTPAGDLLIIIWGLNSAGQNTFWGVKSTDNGMTWSIPFIIATEPSLSAAAEFPHISDMNHANYAFVLFQAQSNPYWYQYALRFPTAGGPGTIVSLTQGSSTEYSYYTGNCKPIAFDPVANVLYECFRNYDLSATTICHSLDLGLTFATTGITFAQRYPSLAVRSGTATPFVFSNAGLPSFGAYHSAWFSYRQGGIWSTPQTLATAPAPFDGTRPLFYQNEGYFWDDQHGVAMNNLWGEFTPEGIYSERTTTGGMSWTPAEQRWNYLQAPGFEGGSIQNGELVGGVNGVAYITFSGNPDQILPVELSVFDAAATTNGIHLHLATASEHDNDHFDILRAPSESGPFTALTTLPSHGSSSTEQDYNYVDRAVTSGQSYWYYPVAVSVSGERTAYTDHMRHATALSASVIPTDYSLHAYPNPFNPQTTISVALPEAAHIRLEIFDLTGRRMSMLADGAFAAGTHAVVFDASSLPSGVYVARLQSGAISLSYKLVLLK